MDPAPYHQSVSTTSHYAGLDHRPGSSARPLSMIAGYQYMTAGGSVRPVESAKPEPLKRVFIGLAIAMLCRVLAKTWLAVRCTANQLGGIYRMALDLRGPHAFRLLEDTLIFDLDTRDSCFAFLSERAWPTSSGIRLHRWLTACGSC